MPKNRKKLKFTTNRKSRCGTLKIKNTKTVVNKNILK